MAGNCSAACGELDNGIVVGLLIVDGLRRAACGRDDLSGHLALGIVVIPRGVDHVLRGYDLTRKLDVCLGSADDIAVIIVDIEKPPHLV